MQGCTRILSYMRYICMFIEGCAVLSLFILKITLPEKGEAVPAMSSKHCTGMSGVH
jgi:hypothetical protein